MFLKHPAVLVLCIGFANGSRVTISRNVINAGDNGDVVDQVFSAGRAKQDDEKHVLNPCTDCGAGPTSALDLGSQKLIDQGVTKHRVKDRTMRARRERRRELRKAQRAMVQRRSGHRGGLTFVSKSPGEGDADNVITKRDEAKPNSEPADPEGADAGKNAEEIITKPNEANTDSEPADAESADAGKDAEESIAKPDGVKPNSEPADAEGADAGKDAKEIITKPDGAKPNSEPADAEGVDAGKDSEEITTKPDGAKPNSEPADAESADASKDAEEIVAKPDGAKPNSEPADAEGVDAGKEAEEINAKPNGAKPNIEPADAAGADAGKDSEEIITKPDGAKPNSEPADAEGVDAGKDAEEIITKPDRAKPNSEPADAEGADAGKDAVEIITKPDEAKPNSEPADAASVDASQDAKEITTKPDEAKPNSEPADAAGADAGKDSEEITTKPDGSKPNSEPADAEGADAGKDAEEIVAKPDGAKPNSEPADAEGADAGKDAEAIVTKPDEAKPNSEPADAETVDAGKDAEEIITKPDESKPDSELSEAEGAGAGKDAEEIIAKPDEAKPDSESADEEGADAGEDAEEIITKPDEAEPDSEPADAEGADAGKEEAESAGGKGDADQKAVALSTATNIWMQTGWLVLFVGFLFALFSYLTLSDLLWEPPGEKWQNTASLERLGQESGSVNELIMKQLNGLGSTSSAVNAIIIGLGVWNLYTYAVETEMILDPDYKLLGYPIDKSKNSVEYYSLVILSPITLARLATVHTHPDWCHYGETACLRYGVANIYTFVDLIALGVTLYSFKNYTHTGHLNLLWLFLFRSCEMLGGGLGVKRLTHMVTDDGKLLLVAFVFAQVIWLIMSGLYFMANHDNKEAIWKDGGGFKRFQSIPSSMWYVLINLLKEHPLADVHTTFFQRILCIIVCIFAMPVFAIPASILQNALFHKGDADDEEEENMRRRRTAAEAQHLAELQAESLGDNFYLGLGTCFLCLGSILTYFYHTAEGQPEGQSLFFVIHVNVNAATFAKVDGAVAVCFLGEYAWRASIGGAAYAFSGYGLIDLWAWLPGLYNLCTYETIRGSVHALLCAACVLRILKLERYLHSFQDMIDIVKENSSILSATLVLTALIWSFFSVIFYLTERNNLDGEMNEDVYGSVLRSMWAEVINLHGEWPWADYTVMGKAVGTVVGFFSIMLFCIPISIFGNGFQEKVKAERDRSSEDEELDRRPWQLKIKSENPGCLYRLFYGHLWGRGGMGPFAIRWTLTPLLVASTLVTIFSTVEDLKDLRDIKTSWGMACLCIDITAVAVFSIEYLARLAATGGQHAMSFVGMMEVISLAAIVYTCLPENHSSNDMQSMVTIMTPGSWNFTNINITRDAFVPSYKDDKVLPDSIVLLRLLHLWSLDNWIHSVNTMKNVFFLNRWPMARAGGALVSTWFTHATLMYLCENPKAFGESVVPTATPLPQEVDMPYRYRSILSALQYSIVHLFGDYPETDYTFAAKAVQFAAILGGIAIISTFCGVFSAGFVDYLEAMRAHEKKEALDRSLRTAIRIRTSMKKALQRARERLARGNSLPPPEHAVSFAQPGLCKFLRHFFEAVVIVALINSLVSSIPEVDQMKPWGPYLTNGTELVCTCIFGLEYLILFVSSPRKAFSFWGILALVCCLPGVLIVVLKPNQENERMIEALGMLRAMRILNFAYFQKETRIMSLALSDALPKLAIPAYISLNVWITTSALFMWLENEYREEGPGGTADDMPDVPSAMYFCSIFLTGEWANVDFTYAGSRLCIFYVVFGIAMFSMPVGIIVEAVQSTLVLVHQEDRNMKKLLKQHSDSLQEQRQQLSQQLPSEKCNQQLSQQLPDQGIPQSEMPIHWRWQEAPRPTWMAAPDQGSFGKPKPVSQNFRQKGWF